VADISPLREVVDQAVHDLNLSPCRRQKVSLDYDQVGPARFGWFVSGSREALAPAFGMALRLRDPTGTLHSVAVGCKALAPVSAKSLVAPMFFIEEGATWLTAGPRNNTQISVIAARACRSGTLAYWSKQPKDRALAACGTMTEQLVRSHGVHGGSPALPGYGDFRWLGFASVRERSVRSGISPAHQVSVMLARDKPIDGVRRFALLTALANEWASWHPDWKASAL
jgi:hypothetical protein